jgi:hypothetical protein
MGAKLSSLFGGLFGRKEAAGEAPAAEAASEYKGYAIRPAPRKQGANWLLAGTIAKQFPEGLKEHHFVRADTFASRDEAVAFAVTKARQIIDEQGDRIFGEGAR